MINPVRGEIEANLDGKSWTLCLTLGALASLEAWLDASSLPELGERFSSGNIRSNDLIKVITAGLNGAGHNLSLDDVSKMRVDGGITGYAEIASRLLEATFAPMPKP